MFRPLRKQADLYYENLLKNIRLCRQDVADAEYIKILDKMRSTGGAYICNKPEMDQCYLQSKLDGSEQDIEGLAATDLIDVIYAGRCKYNKEYNNTIASFIGSSSDTESFVDFPKKLQLILDTDITFPINEQQDLTQAIPLAFLQWTAAEKTLLTELNKQLRDISNSSLSISVNDTHQATIRNLYS
jgi:hypothetical protein